MSIVPELGLHIELKAKINYIIPRKVYLLGPLNRVMSTSSVESFLVRYLCLKVHLFLLKHNIFILQE